ncbi:hypothetical protein IWZ00DRAFT_493159 [Phyllosticta capitalensis]
MAPPTPSPPLSDGRSTPVAGTNLDGHNKIPKEILKMLPSKEADANLQVSSIGPKMPEGPAMICTIADSAKVVGVAKAPNADMPEDKKKTGTKLFYDPNAPINVGKVMTGMPRRVWHHKYTTPGFTKQKKEEMEKDVKVAFDFPVGFDQTWGGQVPGGLVLRRMLVEASRLGLIHNPDAPLNVHNINTTGMPRKKWVHKYTTPEFTAKEQKLLEQETKLAFVFPESFEKKWDGGAYKKKAKGVGVFCRSERASAQPENRAYKPLNNVKDFGWPKKNGVVLSEEHQGNQRDAR